MTRDEIKMLINDIGTRNFCMSALPEELTPIMGPFKAADFVAMATAARELQQACFRLLEEYELLV